MDYNCDSKQENYIIEKQHAYISPVSTLAIATFYLGACLIEPIPLPSFVDCVNREGHNQSLCICFDDSNSNHSEFSSVVDLLKQKNLMMIREMSQFKKNWNGNDGEPFSKEAISLFRKIIVSLKRQPEIAPTGRNSMLIQYDYKEKIIAYEVRTNMIEEVFIPDRDFTKASSVVFTTDLVNTLIDRVENKYELR